MMLHHAGPLVISLAVCMALQGCGAKTGLLVPDVPEDRSDEPDAPSTTELCVSSESDAGIVTVNLETRPQLSVADIFLVIDRTGSMDGEIDNIKTNLQNTIMPQIAASISDVQFGVATYSDFPISPYGDHGDVPFTLVAPVDRNVANVQGAVNSIMANGGGDNPEAAVEALYQIVTGEGYLPWISPRSPCAAPGRSGYACFRRDALPIVLLINDAPMHNGPALPTGAASQPYEEALFLAPPPGACPGAMSCRPDRAPRRYEDALAALRGLGARVIGINSGTSGTSGLADMTRLALDTGTVTAAGAPLVITIRPNGSDLDSRVVAAVQTFTRQVRFNASARVVDLDPARPASRIVRAVRPGFASPSSGVQRADATTFYGVIPGTRLTFTLVFVAPLPVTRETQRFPARVQFLGGGRANLGHRDIEIVIPGAGMRCDARVPSDAGM